MPKPGQKITTLYAYRTASGYWGPYSDNPGFIAYDYCSRVTDLIGGALGLYAELLQVDRYTSDYAVTGRHWEDVRTTVRMYGKRPENYPDFTFGEKE